jgi:hypothetical protein
MGLILPLLRPADMLVDPDTYLHIAVGRWMIEHRALPFHDPFSSSMPGAPWVPHEWLAELVYAAVYKVGGWAGALFVTTACFGLSLGVFARRLLVHCEPFTALIMTTMTAGLACGHLLARPHVLAFPILALWSGALITARDTESPPSLWLLPLMTLWANCHGSFLFGLALALYLGLEAVISAGTAAAQRRSIWRWGGFLVLATLAGLITPYGLDGVWHPFLLMAMPTAMGTFSEWLPPDLRADHVLTIWVLGAMGLGLGLGVKLPLTRLVLLLGLYYETFQSARHVDLLCLVGPLAVAAALGPQLATRIRTDPPSALALWMARWSQPANRLGVGLAGVLVLLVGITIVWRAPQPINGTSYPVAAVAAAKALDLTGPVLNEESFGGYLAFVGIAPFIDGRIEMYGDAFLSRWAHAALGDRDALVGLLDRYHISWTLFPRDRQAVQTLDMLPGWRRAYADDQAVIHVRDGAGSAVPVGAAE